MSGPQRLPAAAPACARPTRHPDQTPARRALGDAALRHQCGITSRRVDAVVSQPRSRSPCPQLDVADHSERRTASPIPRYRQPFGVRRPSVRGTLFRPATTMHRGTRLRIHHGRTPASSSHRTLLRSAGSASDPAAPSSQAPRRRSARIRRLHRSTRARAQRGRHRNGRSHPDPAACG